MKIGVPQMCRDELMKNEILGKRTKYEDKGRDRPGRKTRRRSGAASPLTEMREDPL